VESLKSLAVMLTSVANGQPMATVALEDVDGNAYGRHWTSRHRRLALETAHALLPFRMLLWEPRSQHDTPPDAQVKSHPSLIDSSRSNRRMQAY